MTSVQYNLSLSPTLDLAIAVLGELANETALNTTQYPEVEIGDDATPQARSTFDHMLAQARLADGSALSVEVARGRPLTKLERKVCCFATEAK